MRLLTSILVLLLLLPAAPVTACDGMSGDTGASMAHAGHPGMSGEQAGHGDHPSGHDCCADETAPRNCDAEQHCTAPTPGAAFAGLQSRAAQAWPPHLVVPRSGADIPPSHSQPPYRPPSV
ncbi:hypothetical protein [Elongatibacter sediminis]|uniref:Uncharacterized protein n=1 Tax=Elongatibacter sediminis TaxID=3119006 RepID=A0AAW9RBC8_9GAMM